VTDQPEQPLPAAPALVRDFVNTEDHELGTDELSTPAGLGSWLRDRDLWDGAGEVGSGDLELARALRAGLRRALERNHDGDAGAPPELGDIVSRLPVALGWGETGPQLVAAGGGIGAGVARIGIAALDSASSGTWPRLKICSADDCAWAYFDHSRNRSRHWCEYGCGNKAKTRAYRQRIRAQRS
jgi:predicted RNA-binding Zn ribbon-like protein